MSKASRKRKKEKRSADKRRKKSANRAQYAAWRDQGINQKSHRAKQNKIANRKVRAKRKRVRIKVMSDVPKRDGGFLTLRQTKNQMSWKQFLQQL